MEYNAIFRLALGSLARVVILLFNLLKVVVASLFFYFYNC